MKVDQKPRAVRPSDIAGLVATRPGDRPAGGSLRLPPRSLVLKVHRWLSLGALVWILVIALTGSVLVFGPQVEAWSRPELFEATPGDDGPQAAVDAALAHFEARSVDAAIDFIGMPADNRGVYVLDVTVTERPSAEQLASGEEGAEPPSHSWVVYVDPGAGEVNGARREASGFVYWCKRGHFLLWQDAGFGGIAGDDLAGLVALCMLFISLSGMYIWWFPRVKRWFRNLFRIRGRQGALPFNLDLHRTLGMAVVFPLTVIAFTGAAFAFPDMKLAWERLTPAQHDYVQNEPDDDLVSEEVEGADVLTTDGALRLLEERYERFPVESLEPPTESDGLWGAWLTRGYSPWQRDNTGGNMYVNIDRFSHEVVYEGTPEDGNVWDQAWEEWSVPLHSGDFGGNVSRSIWLVVGLSPVLLSGTGVIVWWRRRRRRGRGHTPGRRPGHGAGADDGRADGGGASGEVIDLTDHARDPVHAECVDRLTELFVTRVGGEARVRVRGPLRLDEAYQPEPDLALVRPGHYGAGHPGAGDTLLVVHVSGEHGYDEDVRLLVYALAGVPEVWVVDPGAGTVDAYAGPGASGWSAAACRHPGETLHPWAIPGVVFTVAEMLASPTHTDSISHT